MQEVSAAAETAEKPLRGTQKAPGNSLQAVRQDVTGTEDGGSVSDKRWLDWKTAYANRRSAAYLLLTLGRNLRAKSEVILRKKVS